MKVDVTLTGIDNVIDLLKSLPPEVVSKNGGVVRKSLVKGANIIRNQARINLARVTKTAGKTGENYGTGFSASRVITKRKLMPAGENGERYIITVKYEDYPNTNNKYKKRPIKANDIAFMLEYGTSKQSAEPWFSPAFRTKAQEAINVSRSTLIKEIDKIVNKLSKNKTGGK